MWVNLGQIQWRRNKDFTQTMKTGPSRDHTTGKGMACYFTVNDILVNEGKENENDSNTTHRLGDLS